MTRVEKLKERFVLLSEVLRYAKQAAYLSTGQKICINQERAALLRCIVADHNNTIAKKGYTLPASVEKIVQRVIIDYDIKYSDLLFDNYIVL